MESGIQALLNDLHVKPLGYAVLLCDRLRSQLEQQLAATNPEAFLTVWLLCVRAQETPRRIVQLALFGCISLAVSDQSRQHADLAVPSWEAVAQRRPSGVVQTCTTQPVCPSSTWAQLPLTTSHTRAVKSSEPVTTRLLSGVSATDHTAPATKDPAAIG